VTFWTPLCTRMFLTKLYPTVFVIIYPTCNYVQGRIHGIGVFTIGPLGPCPPPFELRKNLAYGKKCNQNAPFQAKISKILCGGGTAPSPDPTPTREGNTPDQTLTFSSPHPQRRSPRPPPNFFPNFYIITLDSDAVIDEFGKSNRNVG